MKISKRYSLFIIALLLLLWGVAPAGAALFIQCPGDLNGDAIPDPFLLNKNGKPSTTPNPDYDPNVVCKHITGGDGFARLADGNDVYTFSFGDYTGQTPLTSVVANQSLKALLPAPRISVEQDQELYLTMTNVGMVMRPDLFDPHSVHWHGFPNAAPIFDGLPEPSPTANMGASFTYYYLAAVPGNYFYHCHVEAAEHMQMGMIGNLWVYPRQDREGYGGDPSTIARRKGGPAGAPWGYVYNDGDGSTAYDVEYPLQFTGFDRHFHDQHLAVQPLPFAAMHDNYTMINGRGYPDTINPGQIRNQDNFPAQTVPTIITASSGQRILLRVSNVSTTHIYSFATTLGVPMKVVGRGAALLRGPGGEDTSMTVDVLNVAGGQAFDVIISTAGVTAGTYFLYATTLENLANGDEERGGLMTEIRIN